ncbi:MAG: SBBP repeat-containing protein [Desulfobacter sp.]|nr:MAG: SBBP repeat-containing protein [Desulfobacter sp.]
MVNVSLQRRQADIFTKNIMPKGDCPFHHPLRWGIQVLIILLLAVPVSIALANPEGGNVVQGQAVINKESATKTTIHQISDKAIINWQQFNIGKGEHTRFVQPSKTAVTLNRVTGQDPSKILGKLSANGQVFLVNPNGIVVGKDSRIDVAGLMASTADITDENFMAGRYEFNISGHPDAKIINQGSINIEQGGLVALVAPHVENQGCIIAKLGRVVLAGADRFTLDLYGDDLIALEVGSDLLERAQTADGQSLKQLVSNSGTIQADGGYVLLTTDVAKDVLDQVINMDGYVVAQSAEERNGTIVLKGGDTADVNISGTIDASAGDADVDYAGEVRITAGEIIRLDRNAQILAHGHIEGADGGFVAIATQDVQNINGTVSVKALNLNNENGWLYIGNNIDAADTMRNPNLEGAGVQPDQSTVLFEENLGQTDANVNFLTRTDSATLYLTTAEAVLSMETGENTNGNIEMGLSGSNTEVTAIGENKQQSYSNYYIGNDESNWVEGASHYGAVRYKNVYNGIDLVYYGNKNGDIEYDLVVSEGADVSQIAMNYKGASNVVLNEVGDLVITLGERTVIQKAPLTYQVERDAKVIVPSRYELREDGQVNIQTDDYDATRLLVVDPILEWSSYLGGSNSDYGRGIAVDDTGSIFVTGSTSSADFNTSNGFDTTLGGTQDAFVTKISSNGSILWSSYFGGNNSDNANGIAVDSGGNAVVSGSTSSSNFNTTNGFDTSLGGMQDSFVSKFSSTGALIWSSYLGGSSHDWGKAIVVDENDNILVTGYTNSSNFDTSSGFDTALGGTQDAFISKISSGGVLSWSSYLGGSGTDQGFGIATDGNNNIFVTGQTNSADFDTSRGFDTSLGGTWDAFITKISSNGSVSWSSYLGGSGNENYLLGGFDVSADRSGNVWVTGPTASADFNTVNGFDTTLGGPSDAYVTKISSSGSVSWSSYLGGSGSDRGVGIALDGNGDAFITGDTSSSDFNTSSGFDTSLGGSWDAFVTKITSNGSVSWSSYYGGNEQDNSTGIALDSAGNIFITGYTRSTDIASNGFDLTIDGSVDAFIAKITDPATSQVTDNVSQELSQEIVRIENIVFKDKFIPTFDQQLISSVDDTIQLISPVDETTQINNNFIFKPKVAASYSGQFIKSEESGGGAKPIIYDGIEITGDNYFSFPSSERYQIAFQLISKAKTLAEQKYPNGLPLDIKNTIDSMDSTLNLTFLGTAAGFLNNVAVEDGRLVFDDQTSPLVLKTFSNMRPDVANAILGLKDESFEQDGINFDIISTKNKYSPMEIIVDRLLTQNAFYEYVSAHKNANTAVELGLITPEENHFVDFDIPKIPEYPNGVGPILTTINNTAQDLVIAGTQIIAKYDDIKNDVDKISLSYDLLTNAWDNGTRMITSFQEMADGKGVGINFATSFVALATDLANDLNQLAGGEESDGLGLGANASKILLKISNIKKLKDKEKLYTTIQKVDKSGIAEKYVRVIQDTINAEIVNILQLGTDSFDKLMPAMGINLLTEQVKLWAIGAEGIVDARKQLLSIQLLDNQNINNVYSEAIPTSRLERTVGISEFKKTSEAIVDALTKNQNQQI